MEDFYKLKMWVYEERAGREIQRDSEIGVCVRGGKSTYHDALRYLCMGPKATSVWGLQSLFYEALSLKLLVYEVFSY